MEASWGGSGGSWRRLGTVLRGPGGLQGRSWGGLGRSRGGLGAILGRSGEVLGCPWAAPGGSWGHLERSGGGPGADLENIEKTLKTMCFLMCLLVRGAVGGSRMARRAAWIGSCGLEGRSWWVWKGVLGGPEGSWRLRGAVRRGLGSVLGRPRGVLGPRRRAWGPRRAWWSGSKGGQAALEAWWSGRLVGQTALGRAVGWIRQPRNPATLARLKSPQVVRLSMSPVID